VSGFTAVELDGTGDLNITQTGKESLSITADDNLLPYLTSDVQGGTLHLGVKPNTSIQTSTPIRYQLTVKQLQGITLAGSGSVTTNALNANQLQVTLSGSGNMTLSGITTTSVTATLSGSGNLTTKGQTQTQQVMLSGSGTYQGDGLTSQTATVQVAGSGDAHVNANGTLTATVTGSGDITYTGHPSQVSSSVTGSGTIKPGS
jgi:hypothetical protein